MRGMGEDLSECGVRNAEGGLRKPPADFRRPVFPSASRLQWGHDTSAVENADRREQVQQAEDLQCGHGTSAVENQDRLAYKLHDQWLQCGHGTSAVENAGRGAPWA